MTAASDRSYPGLARFKPRLDALPEPQRALWPRLAVLPPDAVLYGGTALALRLGHRASVDFDLFLPRSFEPGDMAREISALGSLDAAASVHRIPIVGAYAATILPAASRGGTLS